jgi:hypothetical protein
MCEDYGDKHQIISHGIRKRIWELPCGWHSAIPNTCQSIYGQLVKSNLQVAPE